MGLKSSFWPQFEWLAQLLKGQTELIYAENTYDPPSAVLHSDLKAFVNSLLVRAHFA